MREWINEYDTSVVLLVYWEPIIGFPCGTVLWCGQIAMSPETRPHYTTRTINPATQPVQTLPYRVTTHYITELFSPHFTLHHSGDHHLPPVTRPFRSLHFHIHQIIASLCSSQSSLQDKTPLTSWSKIVMLFLTFFTSNRKILKNENNCRTSRST